MNAAWVLTGFARVFLIFERRPREGRLMQDLIVGLIYLSAALSIVAYVFSAPVGTLIATSGVFAIILGLALQSTLADVFSGHRAEFQQTLRGRRLGRARAMAWRAASSRPTGGRPICSTRRTISSSCPTALWPRRGHQPQQPQSQPRREAPDPHRADHGTFGDLGGHADRASEQQLHHADAGADGGDQVAGRPGDRVRAVVPRPGLRGGRRGEARGLRPDLSPCPGGGPGACPPKEAAASRRPVATGSRSATRPRPCGSWMPCHCSRPSPRRKRKRWPRR